MTIIDTMQVLTIIGNYNESDYYYYYCVVVIFIDDYTDYSDREADTNIIIVKLTVKYWIINSNDSPNMTINEEDESQWPMTVMKLLILLLWWLIMA